MENDFDLLDRVSEREIDFALLSALFASAKLRSFLLEHTIGWCGDHKLVKTRMSEWDQGRETDVLMVVETSDNNRFCIMIEDKISAIFQPDQAQAYRKRCNSGTLDGRWTKAVACLFAPDNYIRSARVKDEWDTYLSFEEIIQFSLTADDKSIDFLGIICTQALKKRISMLLPISVEATDFWKAYRHLASDLLPDVPISRLAEAVSATGQWPRFGANRLPPTIFVEHKSTNGRVDLTFDKMSLDSLMQMIPSDLPIDIQPVRTGMSTALRIVVPVIDALRPFPNQVDEVIAALAAVERLLILAEAFVSASPRLITGSRLAQHAG